MIVNMTISFYNVFDHRAATTMLSYRLGEDQIEMMNSILLFLSYPLIGAEKIDEAFLGKIKEIYE
jgi:hypothetical protein